MLLLQGRSLFISFGFTIYLFFFCIFIFFFNLFSFLPLCFSIRLLLPIGNTVIHLDKALARIREYERMKLKADFNTFNAAASNSEASNAPPLPANPAGAEGTRPRLGGEDVYHCAVIHRRTAPLKSFSVRTYVSLCVSVSRRCVWRCALPSDQHPAAGSADQGHHDRSHSLPEGTCAT